jgi:spore germination protein YaaH
MIGKQRDKYDYVYISHIQILMIIQTYSDHTGM